MLKIDTDDVYRDLQDIDLSGSHPSHPNYDKTNKTVPGNVVDELTGRIITSFIGLKPKYHCYKQKKYNEKEERKKIKDVINAK